VFLVVGDAQSLAAGSMGGASVVRPVGSPAEAADVFADALPVLDIPLSTPIVSGRPSPAAAGAVIRWIETAVGLTLSGDASALVTGPISKAPLYEAGFTFPGHTERASYSAAAGLRGRSGWLHALR